MPLLRIFTNLQTGFIKRGKASKQFYRFFTLYDALIAGFYSL